MKNVNMEKSGVQKSQSAISSNKTKRPKKLDNLEETDAKESEIQEEKREKSKKKGKRSRRNRLLSIIDHSDVSQKWWEAECVKYAINYLPVKLYLEELMGSHVVRLTDRKFMLLFRSKIKENWRERQKIRIEERKLKEPSIISTLLSISYKTIVDKLIRLDRKKN